MWHWTGKALTLMKEDGSFFVILSRTLSSRCPVCGQGRLFSKLSRLQRFTDFFLPLDHCENCHFRFGRQPGYYFGVVTPILPMLALVMGVFFVAVAYFGFQPKLEIVLTWGAVGVGVGFFLFFRTAVAIYVALDHAIDPPKPE
jgi:uncharacterized protein (DUF983 family)